MFCSELEFHRSLCYFGMFMICFELYPFDKIPVELEKILLLVDHSYYDSMSCIFQMVIDEQSCYRVIALAHISCATNKHFLFVFFTAQGPQRKYK